MRRVWKYPVSLTGKEFVHKMPKGSKVLSVGVSDGINVIWVAVDKELPLTQRRFRAIWTNTEVGDEHEYVGTIYADAGFWHLWEVM